MRQWQPIIQFTRNPEIIKKYSFNNRKETWPLKIPPDAPPMTMDCDQIFLPVKSQMFKFRFAVKSHGSGFRGDKRWSLNSKAFKRYLAKFSEKSSEKISVTFLSVSLKSRLNSS